MPCPIRIAQDREYRVPVLTSSPWMCYRMTATGRCPALAAGQKRPAIPGRPCHSSHHRKGAKLGPKIAVRDSSFGRPENPRAGQPRCFQKNPTRSAPIGVQTLDSFPDGVRERVEQARDWFRFSPDPQHEGSDARVETLAQAVRARRIVRIHARTKAPRTIHPLALILGSDGWALIDQLDPNNPLHLDRCGDINISARSFAPDRPLNRRG